ncbi:MAG: arylsulfatase [Pirellula sp.]
MNLRYLVFFVALFVFGEQISSNLRSAAAESSKPNILIVLVDDMGYGDPGCFNASSKIATPNIDRLAREGMRFTDAHAAGPVCHPSRYGLMMGRYPFRTDVSRWPKKPLIEEGQTTIASLAKSHGYRTAMVGKWHLGFEEDGYDKRLPGGPADRGFEEYFGMRASTDIPPYFYIQGDRAVAAPTAHIESRNTPGWSRIQGEYWREGGIAPGLELKDVLPRFTDEAIAAIERHGKLSDDKPLMLYLALTAPHTPWLPTAEFRGRSGAEMYGDFAMMVDAMVGRVLGALDAAKFADNTIVFFTSDNGPTWYPEDVKRTGHDSSGGLRGMKGSHWEAGHRVPFIVRWPQRVRPDSVSQQTICFTDVMATIAEIVQAKLPDDAGEDSISFLPDLLEKPNAGQAKRNTLVVGKSLRSGHWKWIEGHEPALFLRPEAGTVPRSNEPAGQLYNLQDDLAETNNLINKYPEMVTKLKQQFQDIRESKKTRP